MNTTPKPRPTTLLCAHVEDVTDPDSRVDVHRPFGPWNDVYEPRLISPRSEQARDLLVAEDDAAEVAATADYRELYLVDAAENAARALRYDAVLCEKGAE